MAVTYAEGRIKMTADGDATEEGQFLIKGVNYLGANGEALVLQDQDDFDIIKMTAETGRLAQTENFDPPIPVKQINLETLAQGAQVIIYV